MLVVRFIVLQMQFLEKLIDLLQKRPLCSCYIINVPVLLCDVDRSLTFEHF